MYEAYCPALATSARFNERVVCLLAGDMGSAIKPQRKAYNRLQKLRAHKVLSRGDDWIVFRPIKLNAFLFSALVYRFSKKPKRMHQ